MGQLDGKVAILTGASGASTGNFARLFAKEGARLVLLDGDPEAASLAEELGDVARFRSLDLTSEAEWLDTIQDVRDREGRLDIIVTNAAVLYQQTIAETPAEQAMDVLRHNFLSVFLAIKTGAGLMKEDDGGSVVVMSSMTTIIPGLLTSAYGASKFAIRSLAKTAALEYGRDGIRVNLLAGPNYDFGPTWTPEHPFGNRPPARQATVRNYPLELRRDRAETSDAVARAALFLASEESKLCTGIDLVVDAGTSAGRYEPIPGVFEI